MSLSTSNPNPATGQLPPQLPSLNYGDTLSGLIAGWASNTGALPNLQDGDPLLAMFQALSTEFVFLEVVIKQLAALTRAQTSTGADLDTWMAQFNFSRLPATYAQGPVTLSVPTALTTNTMAPVGTIVQTSGGAITYQLIADTTQAAYSPTLDAYVLTAGQTSITATAQALTAGPDFNVQAGQISQFYSSLAGINLVSNPQPILNGVSAESDSAFRARFLSYLASLSKATLGAVEAAISSVQQDLTYKVLNNTNINGSYQQGMFTVVVYDTSNAAPSSLLAAVTTAVAAVAPLTVQFQVIGPSLVNGPIALSIAPAPGYAYDTLVPAVQTAVTDYANTVPLGGTIYRSSVSQAALSVPGVAAVDPTSVTINGAANDLILGNISVFVTSAVNVAQYTP